MSTITGEALDAAPAAVVEAARAWLAADFERWTAMPRKRGAGYWRLVDAVHTTWTAYGEALQAAGLSPTDRRAFATELAGGGL